MKTPSQGAATQLYVATSPDVEKYGGMYFVDCNLAETSPHASDPKIAKRLWELSEKMTGLS